MRGSIAHDQGMIYRNPITYTDRVTTALPPAIAAAIRQAARREGVPVAVLVRRAVAAQLVAEGVVQPPAGRPITTRRLP